MDDGPPLGTGRLGSATSRGFRISYEDFGDGEPAIVLIPGAFLSAWDLRDLGYIERLAGFRVLSVDPLGHGRSDKPHSSDAYHAPAIADDVLVAMDDAGVQRAVLWGYSRGAWLAGIAAAGSPSRVAGLIAGGEPLIGLPDPTAPWMEPLERGDWAGAFAALPPMSDDERKMLEENNDPRAMAAVYRGAREKRYELDLSGVQARAFVYCGSDDAPDRVRATADALGVQLHVIEGRDHGGALSDLDTVMPLVLDFIGSVA